MEKKCKRCKKIIVDDFQRYLNENPNENEIQCPYCGFIEVIR